MALILNNSEDFKFSSTLGESFFSIYCNKLGKGPTSSLVKMCWHLHDKAFRCCHAEQS